ncbi:hypoxanthine phosphoribosyltransferase [bacterium]|nr:hypoxanthine phosphoribosyltransferase [bacterium]
MKDLSEIKVLFSEDEIQSAINELANTLNDYYKKEDVILICILKGASFFATDLAKRLKMPLQIEFVRLSSYIGEKSTGEIQPISLSLPDLTNKNILIVEDIIDTGRTLKFFSDFINDKYKVKNMKICALLNKKAKRAVEINTDYFLFEVEDEFVVGYGLDYNGYYRNLPYVGYLN